MSFSGSPCLVVAAGLSVVAHLVAQAPGVGLPHADDAVVVGGDLSPYQEPLKRSSRFERLE